MSTNKKTAGMDTGIASFMQSFSGPKAPAKTGAAKQVRNNAAAENGSRFHSRRGRPSGGAAQERDEIVTTMHVDSAQYEQVRDLAYENRVSIKEMWYRLVSAGIEAYGKPARS